MQVIDTGTSDLENEHESLLPAQKLSDTNPQQTMYLSVCDIWKDSVHKLITKAQYQTPIYLNTWLEVHTEFLHCIDNLYGTCYIWQKQYFDKLGVDKKIITAYGGLCEKGIESTTDFMDFYAKYKKLQADMIVNSMKIGNNLIHCWIDAFGQAVSFWNFQLK